MTKEQITAIISEELNRASEQIRVQLQLAGNVALSRIVAIMEDKTDDS